MITRQICYVMMIAGIFALLGLSPAIYAQHQWTSLDGPYWASGVDVAYGNGGNGLAWHRYLAGNDGGETEVFYWRGTDNEWLRPQSPQFPLSAKKLISYKVGDNGDIAIGSVYDDDIWKTTDGGVNWNRMFFPSNFNTHFSSVEVPNSSQGVGNVIMVGTEAQQGMVSTYYSHVEGSQLVWDPIGQSSSEGLRVYDIESFPEPTFPPHMAIGTIDGLYINNFDSWDAPWDQVAFGGSHVPVLESIDGWDDGKQIAAVSESGARSLHLTKGHWNSFNYELRPDGNVFDKEVRDLAAIYWYGPEAPISCYAATSEGIFLIDIDAEPTPVCTAYNLLNTPYGAYPPLRYDFDFKSVDYYFKGGSSGVNDSAFIIATTPYNVYQIIESRDYGNNNITGIKVSEIVTGTFISDVRSLSFPENSESGKKIFTISENSLIKKFDKEEGEEEESWKLIGLAFDGNGSGVVGTDIAIDLSGPEELILASSRTTYTGTIMFSPDGGVTWANITPAGNPVINTIDFDEKDGSDRIYAAGVDDHIWLSTNNGLTWLTPGDFIDPDFHDIYADAYYPTNPRVYFGGTGNPKSIWFDGTTWYPNENGLSEIESVFQIAKFRDYFELYAGTDRGPYKTNMLFYPNNQWTPRTYGTGTSSIISLINDPSDRFIFMAATNNAIEDQNPKIYASYDSTRSWTKIFNGDIATADVHINKLAASRGENQSYLVGTDKGVFYLGNIFKSGVISSYETWGPGQLFVSNYLRIDGTVQIVPPCTVYVRSGFGSKISLHGTLDVNGQLGDSVVFTSSDPFNKLAGDWYGIELFPNSELDLEYSVIEYASFALIQYYTLPINFKVKKCRFSDLFDSGAAIDLLRPGIQSEILIENSTFYNCGSYAIRIKQDELTGNKSTIIKGNLIKNCSYGIWYSGDSNESGEKQIRIENNIITQDIPNSGYFGIYIEKHSSSGFPPVVKITSDSISYFGKEGIHLTSVSPLSVLVDNRVKHNGSYGIYLQNSSPEFQGDLVYTFNRFTYSNTGMYCDEHSHPKVRRTKIKENFPYAVLIDSEYPSCDFGTSSDWGYNSIHTILQPNPSYRDMLNRGDAEVSAVGNWWGEPRPDPLEIEGDVDYSYPLSSDPLPGSGKRGVFVEMPEMFVLNQNNPNPFNPTTAISLYLVEPSQANLKIYNLQGQLVKTLVSGQIESGSHIVTWNGTNSRGQDVSSGIYFYVLSTDYGKTSKRMTLLR